MREDGGAAVDNSLGGGVVLVPRSERGDGNAAVYRDQRRKPSRVERTSAAESGGSLRRGTATTPRPRRTSRMGVAAGSISRRPSVILASSG
jgi:hypothetical protein